MAATSPFSTCVTPKHQNSAIPVSSDKRKHSSNPQRPHTTTAASSTFWAEIRDLTTDVKDGLTQAWDMGTCFDDISEFVEPHFESLGIIDQDGKKGAQFFTFDKVERLLNYCVPLPVDPRSPKSRARDMDDIRDEDDTVDATFSLESVGKRTDDEEIDDWDSKDLDSLVDLTKSEQRSLQSLSADTIPGFSEGLMEHTNRLREKVMGINDNRAMTTPARILEKRMDLQGRSRTSSSSSSDERDDGGVVERNPPVLVPGGLWSLPSEERYGNSLSASFTDSRSMHSNISEDRYNTTGTKNPYYCGPNKMDDVLMMRSMSEDQGTSESQGSESYDDFPSDAGSDVIDSMNNSSGTRYERNDLGLDTDLGLDNREDMDEVLNAAAMNAINESVSPRSLASEDKYKLDDHDADARKKKSNNSDPYAHTNKLSHYRRDAKQPKSMYEGGADEQRIHDNEAINRHFDNLMSDFELNLHRQDDSQSKNAMEKLRIFQQQKNLAKRSRENKMNATSRSNTDDISSRTSRASNHTTASFLSSTTMGRKLNRSVPSSPGSKESVINRARDAVTQVHQVMDSISRKDERQTNHNMKRVIDPPIQEKDQHESSLMSSSKKRLMQKRSRRIRRDNAKRGSHDITKQAPSIEPDPSVENNTLDKILQDPNLEATSICDSGAASFDSSVNWDTLAYSMSGSVSEMQVPKQNIAPEAKRPDPVEDQTPVYTQDGQNTQVPPTQHQSLARIEQVSTKDDKNVVQLRMQTPENRLDDAPDDECGTNIVDSHSEEENKPMSPNSISSNDYLSPTSMAAVQKHIDALKQQLEKEIVHDTSKNAHRGELGKLSSQQSLEPQRRSSKFNFDTTSRPSQKKVSTEDLMLSNLKLEEEMKKIRALSPRSPESWSSPRSPPSKTFGDQVSSPLSIRSQRDKDGYFSPSFSKMNTNNSVLGTENPTSPVRRLSQFASPVCPTSSPLIRTSYQSPGKTRARTRVSDLMEEVKGFLAENDKARERIAADMDAMQAFHKY